MAATDPTLLAYQQAVETRFAAHEARMAQDARSLEDRLAAADARLTEALQTLEATSAQRAQAASAAHDVVMSTLAATGAANQQAMDALSTQLTATRRELDRIVAESANRQQQHDHAVSNVNALEQRLMAALQQQQQP